MLHIFTGRYSVTRWLDLQKPEEYGKRLPERSSFLGKQLANAPPKEGKTTDTYFEKKHNWIADVSEAAP